MRALFIAGKFRTSLSLYLFLFSVEVTAQDILPPVLPWKGKSLELISKKDHAWATPAERSGFSTSPSYSETMEWLSRLCESSEAMTMVSIGKSAEYRDIKMVIASLEGFDQQTLNRSQKPLILIQAGIHAGEIDGKDAGMMLLRDIAFGSKKELLKYCNLLFIPILSVDGHERASKFNRVNQRGPDNMGWRTNSRNLNLNRDYAKADTEEVRAVIKVLSDYSPDLYLDIHVTDGADYQYDITYGYSEAYSPSIAKWFSRTFSPFVDQHLRNAGHIPGPLIFAANDRDFDAGIREFVYSPRFSNGYADARHIPAILIENHSLKPFRQRVLGTYVFLEGVIRLMSTEGKSLLSAKQADLQQRAKEIPLSWERSGTDTVDLLVVQSAREISSVTGAPHVVWKGRAETRAVPFARYRKPSNIARRPVAYWVPGAYTDVIERLRAHGIAMEVITAPEQVDVRMYRITKHQFASAPFEGRFPVSVEVEEEKRTETFYPGSVRIETDQPLGDLAILLLHPLGTDSFLQWGFFSEIFSRTEYIEEYAIDPLARQMLLNDKDLAREFEQKKQEDPLFRENPRAIYEWFYQKSPYSDKRWLLYPVGEE